MENKEITTKKSFKEKRGEFSAKLHELFSAIKLKFQDNKISEVLSKNKTVLAGLAVVFIICFTAVYFNYSKQKVSIYVDGQIENYCYISSAETVADALSKTKTEISYNDYIYPSITDTVGENGRIDIYKPADLTIQYNGQAYSITTPLTGKDAVRQAGLEVDDDDVVNTDKDSNTLNVYSIETTRNNETISIKHDTKIVKN